jgi:hypothetical protein
MFFTCLIIDIQLIDRKCDTRFHLVVYFFKLLKTYGYFRLGGI